MIIAEIVGGLGNQLFEYAHARALSIKLNQELRFDLSFFERYHIPDVYRLNFFNTNINIATSDEIDRIKRRIRKPDLFRRIYKKVGGSPYINTKHHFDNNRIDSCEIDSLRIIDDLYISGYFDSEKYFSNNIKIIKKEFTLKEPLNLENLDVMFQIIESNSVSIHIRRGDYVGNPFFAEIPIDYYYKAVNYIEDQSPDSIYYIFSDDLEWVRSNLHLNRKMVFVKCNNAKTDYMELKLMAACKHNIIANSSFSWWGAWLNDNPSKIVISPSIWYNNNNNNITPANWLKF